MSSSANKIFESLVTQITSDLRSKIARDIKSEMPPKTTQDVKSQALQNMSENIKSAVSLEMKQVKASVGDSIKQQLSANLSVAIDAKLQLALKGVRSGHATEFEEMKKQVNALTQRIDGLDRNLQEMTKTTTHLLPIAEKVMDLKITAMEKSMSQNHTSLEQRIAQAVHDTQDALALQVDNLTDISGEVKNLQHEISKMSESSEPSSERAPGGEKGTVLDLISLDNETPPVIVSKSKIPFLEISAVDRFDDQGRPKNNKLYASSSNRNYLVDLKPSSPKGPDADHDQACFSTTVNDDATSHASTSIASVQGDGQSQTSGTSLEDDEITLLERERCSY